MSATHDPNPFALCRCAECATRPFLVVRVLHEAHCKAPVGACSCNQEIAIGRCTPEQFAEAMRTDLDLRSAIAGQLDESATTAVLTPRKRRK